MASGFPAAAPAVGPRGRAHFGGKEAPHPHPPRPPPPGSQPGNIPTAPAPQELGRTAWKACTHPPGQVRWVVSRNMHQCICRIAAFGQLCACTEASRTLYKYGWQSVNQAAAAVLPPWHRRHLSLDFCKGRLEHRSLAALQSLPSLCIVQPAPGPAQHRGAAGRGLDGGPDQPGPHWHSAFQKWFKLFGSACHQSFDSALCTSRADGETT